jgi:hypothetical protein
VAVIINWLHLTDLHVGTERSSWLWPRIKHELLHDLEEVRPESGGWDVVFFTGDLTQSGSEAEYQALNKELADIWDVLSRGGPTPKLCVVPGNHDLVRPPASSPVAKTLSQLWWADDELREEFWRSRTKEYVDAIAEFFANYSAWLNKCPVPLVAMKTGIIPGDFSASVSKDGISLGVLGLNSSFLQVTGGDFEGKLDLHASQLAAVCDNDPSGWTNRHTASVLLTHHPLTWLAKPAIAHFRQEIHPPGRFLAHLCGHQHDPASFELSEAGAPPRRVRQGASLFGLSSWEDASGGKKQRIHGYNSGAFEFDGASGVEKIWPRITTAGRHGGLNFCPDHTYKLTDNYFSTEFELLKREGERPAKTPTPPSPQKTTPSGNSEQVAAYSPDILDAPPDPETARRRLKSCPRLARASTPQHRVVRQSEQSEFEAELRKQRRVWLNADWGMGADGFLAASLERFQVPGSIVEVFHLRCEDALTPEGIEPLFSQQFGMPLPQFCGLVSALSNSFLILDEVQPELRSASNIDKFERLLSAVSDYCPDLRVVVVSRVAPADGCFSVVELRPLDVPDVRSYALNHVDTSSELQESEAIERVHERSDGLPMHIDRILRALKVESLSSILEAELDAPIGLGRIGQDVSKALARTILTLAVSEEKRTQRSFLLLKVLSVLPHGETLATLKHYLSSQPFFEENALTLKELALLNVISLQQASPHLVTGSGRATDGAAPKLLKVPRQVRDCVRTLVSEGEMFDIVLAGVQHFFGRDWRRGKVKLRRVPLGEREYVTGGVGNEFNLLHNLLAHCVAANDKPLLKKGALLAIQYARTLQDADRYRDLAAAAGDLLQLLDQAVQPTEWRQLAVLHAEGLRMTGKGERAIEYLRAALVSPGDSLSRAEQSSIWLSIALTAEGDDNETAVHAANKVLEYTDSTSGDGLQARALILKESATEQEKIRGLIDLEKEARAEGALTASDNIALSLAACSKDPADKIRHIDRVLNSKDAGYTRFRAIVAKADAVRQAGRPGSLTPSELRMLIAAYSYLHTQRFSGLFDRCHRALWENFEKDEDTNRLLRLFRHTSFLWRIRGDESKEAEYLGRVRPRVEPAESSLGAAVVLEVRYVMQRIKAVLVS